MKAFIDYTSTSPFTREGRKSTNLETETDPEDTGGMWLILAPV